VTAIIDKTNLRMTLDLLFVCSTNIGISLCEWTC